MFRSRTVTKANAVMVPVGAAFFSMFTFYDYMQNGPRIQRSAGWTRFHAHGAGYYRWPQISSRTLPTGGVRPLLLIETAFATAGFFWLTQVLPHRSYLDFVPGPSCAVALEFGLLFTALASAGTAGVPSADAGVASGVLSTRRGSSGDRWG
jgi:hypothetical protein